MERAYKHDPGPLSSQYAVMALELRHAGEVELAEKIKVRAQEEAAWESYFASRKAA